MAGLFDDLIPGGAQGGGGLFDDLIPATRPPGLVADLASRVGRGAAAVPAGAMEGSALGLARTERSVNRTAQSRLEGLNTEIAALVEGLAALPEGSPLRDRQQARIDQAAGRWDALASAQGEMREPPSPAGMGGFEIGQNIRAGAADRLPTDPARDEDLVSIIADAIGQTSAQAALSLIPGVGVAAGPFSVMGGASANQYDDAVRSGATPDQALDASGSAAVLGLSELAPLGGLVRSGAGPVASRIAGEFGDTAAGKAVAKVGESVVEEGVQEGGAQYGSNLIAQEYDPGRDPMAGVGLATLVGGVTGGTLGSIGGVRTYFAERGKTEPTARDLINEANNPESPIQAEAAEILRSAGIDPTSVADPLLAERAAERVQARRAEDAARDLPDDAASLASVIAERDAGRDRDLGVETGTVDPGADPRVGRPEPLVRSDQALPVTPGGQAVVGDPAGAREGERVGQIYSDERALPVVVGDQPTRMTPREVNQARGRNWSGNPNRAEPPGRMSVSPDGTGMTADGVRDRRQAGQAFRLAERQRQRAEGQPDTLDTRAAGRPEGGVASQSTVFMDEGRPVEILDERLVPDTRGRMQVVARVRQYDPRTGQADDFEYEVAKRDLTQGNYATDPRGAQEFEDTARGPRRPEMPRAATGPVELEPSQTFRQTDPDPQTEGEPTQTATPGAGQDSRAYRPDQESGPPFEGAGGTRGERGPFGRGPFTNAEQAWREFEEREQRRREDEAFDRQEAEREEAARGNYAGAKATNSPRGRDADGGWTVDETGYVLSTRDGPIRFKDQKQAARWIIKTGQADNAAGQTFEIANHPSGQGFTVRETGRQPRQAEPAPGGDPDAAMRQRAQAVQTERDSEQRVAGLLPPGPGGSMRRMPEVLREQEQRAPRRPPRQRAADQQRGGLFENADRRRQEDLPFETGTPYTDPEPFDARGMPRRSKRRPSVREEAAAQSAEIERAWKARGLHQRTARTPVLNAIRRTRHLNPWWRAAQKLPPGDPVRTATPKWEYTGTGVDPDSPVAGNLRAAGVTPKTAPGLFRRHPEARGSLDNMGAGELPALGLPRGSEVGNEDVYFSEQEIVDAIAREVGGGSTLDTEDAALDAAYEDAIRQENQIEQLYNELDALVETGKVDADRIDEIARDTVEMWDGNPNTLADALGDAILMDLTVLEDASRADKNPDNLEYEPGADSDDLDAWREGLGQDPDAAEQGAREPEGSRPGDPRGTGGVPESGGERRPRSGPTFFANPLDPRAVNNLLVQPTLRLMSTLRARLRGGTAVGGQPNPPSGGGGVFAAARRAASWFFDTQDTYVRGLDTSKSQKFTALMDRIWSRSGRDSATAEAGLDAAISSRLNRAVLKAARITEKLSDQSKEKVAQALRTGRGRGLTKPELDAVKSLRGWFDAEFQMMRDAGVDIGQVKRNYYPREYDGAKVAANRNQFVRNATRLYQDNGASRDDAIEMAEALADVLISGGDISFGSFKSTGTPGNIFSAREFGERADLPATQGGLGDFMVDNLDYTLARYASRAAKRASIAEIFGDKFSNWKQIQRDLRADGVSSEAINGFVEYVESMLGVRGGGFSPGSKFLSGLHSWSTISLLEGATLTSLVEPVVAGARTGNIMDSMRNLTMGGYDLVRWTMGLPPSKRKQAARELAEDLGAVAGDGSHSFMLARFHGTDPVGAKQSKILGQYFRLTMLDQFTNYTRAQSVATGARFLKRLALGVNGNSALISEKAARQSLAEFGVTGPKAQADFAAFVNSLPDDGSAPAPGLLKGAQGQIYRNALLRFTDQTIMRPNAATKPKWATSSPVGRVIFALQSFNYAYLKNVLGRTARQTGRAGAALAKGEFKDALFYAQPALVVGMITPILQFALGEARDELMSWFSGEEPRPMTTGAKMERAWSRSGLFGAFDPYIQAVSGTRYGGDVLRGLAGPVFGGMGDGANRLTALISQNSPESTNTERRAAEWAWSYGFEPAVAMTLSLIPGLAGSLVGFAAVNAVPQQRARILDQNFPKRPSTREIRPLESVFEGVARGGASRDWEPTRSQERQLRREQRQWDRENGR